LIIELRGVWRARQAHLGQAARRPLFAHDGPFGLRQPDQRDVVTAIGEAPCAKLHVLSDRPNSGGSQSAMITIRR
jgi:hypothetical protein